MLPPHTEQSTITPDSHIATIIQRITDDGYCVLPNFITPLAVQTLNREARELWEEGEFSRAAVGRGQGRNYHAEIRSDFIHWLDGTTLSPTQQHYWTQIDHLRQQLNQTLFLNVQEFEAHLAIYPAGAFYKRHLDQHQRTQRRQIACILYLNVDWNSADGGQLRIYPRANEWESYLDVEPVGGTLVCFRCDTIYHEVLPATQERYSFTGWLCRRL